MSTAPTAAMTLGETGRAASRLRRWTTGLFEPASGTLLSPCADVLMAGGASIILFVVLKVFVAKTADTRLWGTAIYYAAFLVNYPHFAASYQLLYRDAGKDFFSFRSRPLFAMRLWWAGVIVPLLLVSYFVFALAQGSTFLMGSLVNAMFFFVGWHYIKQVYGCVIVLSAAKKVAYGRWERRVMLAALYSLWLFSYAALNRKGLTQMVLEIPYTQVQVPPGVITALGVLFVFSSLAMVWMFGRRLQQGRPLPPLSAAAAIASIYVWFTPVYSNPSFHMIIPFFHSLQYLLFVLVYKRNESLDLVVQSSGPAPKNAAARRRVTLAATVLFLLIPVLLFAASMTGGFSHRLEDAMISAYGMLLMVSSSQWLTTACIVSAIAVTAVLLRLAARKSALWHFLNFVAQILLLGALLFSVVPTVLDILARNALLPPAMLYNTKAFGTAFYLFAFFVFVNIHHYFVDNVVWRRENPNIRAHLFH